MTRKLAFAALLLWLVTVAAAAVLFIRGDTSPGSDGRTAVIMGGGERDFVLAEMRNLLAAVGEVTAGLADGDRAKIAKAARQVGRAAAGDAPPALLAKLPLDFKRAAMDLHGGFDALAAAAEAGASTPVLAAQLADQLNRCSGCHQAYRFDTAR